MRIRASKSEERGNDRDLISDTSQKKKRSVARINTEYYTENYETREDVIRLGCMKVFIFVYGIFCAYMISICVQNFLCPLISEEKD